MILTYSPARITAQLLIDAAKGTDPASYSVTGSATQWPIYYSNEPDNPDNCITVFDTTPLVDGRSMIDGDTFFHYGIQIRIRSQTHDVGWTRSNLLHEHLSTGVYQKLVNISGTRYTVQCYSGISNVLILGKESPESNRRLFTLNALMSLRQLN